MSGDARSVRLTMAQSLVRDGGAQRRAVDGCHVASSDRTGGAYDRLTAALPEQQRKGA